MPVTNPGANFIDNGINNSGANSVGDGLNNSSASSPPPSSPELDFSQASNSMYIPLLFGYSI